MIKQEKIHLMMEEMERLLDEINMENIVLANFVEEKGLLQEYEAYKQEIESARLQDGRNPENEKYGQEQKDGEKKTYKDRKPVRARLP